MMKNTFIATGAWHAFLNLKDEKLLMVIRKHPFVIIMPIIVITCITLFLQFGLYLVFPKFFSSVSILLATSSLIASIFFTLVAKLIIDWYFHVYVLTNRKILEFRYSPLTSYIVNDIMLDRVYCTEVDFQTNGMIQDLLDIGDIIITFDRPTHQEEFRMQSIQNCHAISTFLAQQLLDGNQTEPITPIWFPGHTWGKR